MLHLHLHGLRVCIAARKDVRESDLGGTALLCKPVHIRPSGRLPGRGLGINLAVTLEDGPKPSPKLPKPSAKQFGAKLWPANTRFMANSPKNRPGGPARGPDAHATKPPSGGHHGPPICRQPPTGELVCKGGRGLLCDS